MPSVASVAFSKARWSVPAPASAPSSGSAARRKASFSLFFVLPVLLPIPSTWKCSLAMRFDEKEAVVPRISTSNTVVGCRTTGLGRPKRCTTRLTRSRRLTRSGTIPPSSTDLGWEDVPRPVVGRGPGTPRQIRFGKGREALARRGSRPDILARTCGSCPPSFGRSPGASHRRVDGARGGGGGPLLLGGGSAAWDPSRERKHRKESTEMEATMRLSGAHTSDFGARGSARGIPLAFGRRTGVPRGRANVQVSKGGGTAGREERGRRKKRVAREADEAIRPGASGKERKTERTGDAWSHDWTATTGAPRNAGTLRRPWIPRDRQVS
eukprot:scaffold752_cov322-Pavlova_lutheri.AAC.26